jgi:NAD-dependent SIR2 family protein deacetylase
MSFMQLVTYRKGRLYCADCAKCGSTMYWHEWTSDGSADDLREGTAVCDECGGRADPETFADCGRQYAGRYSAPGYMDCTSWSYGANLRTLQRELRSMYAD